MTVNPETAQLIQIRLNYGYFSDGEFDITIAPLSILWNFGHNEGQIPYALQLKMQNSHVNYKNVIVMANTVQLLDTSASIDLGAIAKGYIADRLKSIWNRPGIRHGLISPGRQYARHRRKTERQLLLKSVFKNHLPHKMKC